MQLFRNVYFYASVIINLIVYFISYKIGTFDKLSFTNPYVYWCFLFTALTFLCTKLLDIKKDNESEIEALNDKVSKLLIHKDSNPNLLSLSILPDVQEDKFRLDLLTNLQLICNTVIDQSEKPNISIECNKRLFFNMPDCTISEVDHANKYRYFFKNINPTVDYNSKKYWSYKFSFTPKESGIYSITFRLETKDFSSAKIYEFSCT